MCLQIQQYCLLQNLNVGHKRHVERCTGSRKRKQNEGTGHVEIEGLAELEAEEEARSPGSAEEEGDADVKPKKVSGLDGYWLQALGDAVSTLFQR